MSLVRAIQKTRSTRLVEWGKLVTERSGLVEGAISMISPVGDCVRSLRESPTGCQGRRGTRPSPSVDGTTNPTSPPPDELSPGIPNVSCHSWTWRKLNCSGRYGWRRNSAVDTIAGGSLWRNRQTQQT